MKIVGIKVSNILGIEELAINPTSNVIQITGRNGGGKSSVLEAFKDAIGVSEYSTLLRNGEAKGQTVIDLGDMVVTKTYTPSGSKLKVEGRVAGTDSFSELSKPAAILKSLINPNSVDPIKLLTAKPKELLDCVLEAIPMTVDPAHMGNILGRSYQSSPDHALAVIAREMKDITEKRRDINRDMKSAQVTSEQLSGTIVDSELTTEEIHEKINENMEGIDSLKSNARKAIRDVKSQYKEKVSALDSEIELLNDQLLDLQLKLSVAKDKRDSLLESQEEAQEAAEATAMERESEYQRNIDELNAVLTRSAVADNTRAQIAEWDRKANALGKESNTYTKMLNDLQSYKEDLTKDLPIKGLALEDGMLAMNGIPFATLNTAARIALVLELAKLSAGKLGVIVVDDLESLDNDTYKLFVEEASKTDLMFVVARVESHDLEIKS